jgi:pimeloyl-ACP methyl ester carboxylesterase
MRRRIGELELGFEEQGSGRVVLLLPPFPFDRRVFSATVPALVAAGWRVVSVDYPGFGEAAASSPQTLPSIADLAVAARGLLDALGIARVVVAGVSMGGYVALALARSDGHRLDGLILSDTKATGDTPEARAAREQALQTIASAGVPAYLDGSLPKLVAPAAPPATHTLVRSLAGDRADALTWALQALRDRPDRSAELAAIRCPTLVVRGADDQITPDAEMRRMAATIPGARFVELAGSGHLPNLETPQAFNTAVVEFLRGLPSPGGSSAPGPSHEVRR